MRVTYSINQYDHDGDIYDNCILIHMDNTILRFESVGDLKNFIDKLSICHNQILDDMH